MNNRRMLMAYATRNPEKMRNYENGEHIDRMEVNNYYGDWEGRYRDGRGRTHYDNGRYAPMSRREYTVTTDDYYNGGAYSEPYTDTYRPVLGFRADTMHYGYPQTDEMGNRNSKMERGYANHGESYPKLTRPMAEAWVAKMRNGDGSTGEHWGYDQTTQVMRQRNIDCDPVEFYAALNLMYSDYYKVAKALNVNSVEFYAKMAEAFLCDADAAEDKMARYYAVISE